MWWPINPQQQAALECQAEFLLFGGASGGGKSDVLCADGMQEYENPNLRGLLLRKSYGEMNQLMDRMADIYKPFGARWKGDDHTWIFPSGAKIRTGYMASDLDVGKYQGNPYSWLGVDEAGAQSENRIRKILPWLSSTDPRLRVRARFTANPGGEGMAWLLKVFLRGKCPIHKPATFAERDREFTSVWPGRVYSGSRWQSDEGQTFKTVAFIPSLVTDNPLYDKKKIDSLMSQTAEVQEHLLHGCWCAAEGMYFPFLRTDYVMPYATLEDQWWWNHFISIDYGYGNSSAAAGLYCVSPEGRIYKIAERIRQKMASTEFAEMICNDWIVPNITYPGEVITNDDKRRQQAWLDRVAANPDHIQPHRRRMICCYIDPANDQHHGTGQSNKEIMAESFAKYGVSMIDAAKDPAGNALQLHRKLSQRAFILCDTAPKTYESLATRMMDDKRMGAVKKIHGDPLDDLYDECLVEGTLVRTDIGERTIETIEPGDVVATRDGYMPVRWAGITQADAELVVAELSNGRELIGTSNHPLFSPDRGFFRLDEAVYGDNLLSWEELRKSYSTESSTGAIPNQNMQRIESTLAQGLPTRSWATICSTARFGNTITALYLRAMRFITKNQIPRKTISRILSVLRQKSINPATPIKTGRSQVLEASIWKILGHSLRLGIGLAMARKSIAELPKGTGRQIQHKRLSASSVKKQKLYVGIAWLASVQELARRSTGAIQGWMTATTSANYAEKSLEQVALISANIVAVSVLKLRTGGRGRVYNLTVDGCPEFIASGVLVHNCSYAINTWLQNTIKPQEVEINEKIAAMAQTGVDERSLYIHRARLEKEKKPEGRTIPIGRKKIRQTRSMKK